MVNSPQDDVPATGAEHGRLSRRCPPRRGVSASTLPAVDFERVPGASARALAGTYRRLEPEKLTERIARRLMATVARAWEADGNSYLDADLASQREARAGSRAVRIGPVSRRQLPKAEHRRAPN